MEGGRKKQKAELVQQQRTYLARQRASAKITEGQLEPFVGAVDVDLESDEGVWTGGRGCGHGGGCSGGCW